MARSSWPPILLAPQHGPANGTAGRHLAAIGQERIDPDEMLNAEPNLARQLAFNGLPSLLKFPLPRP